MEAGLAALAKGPLAAPRLSDLNAIANRHGRDILGATVGTRVSPAFVLAVIAVESGGRVDAVSHAGAAGLMQLMPATAERFGVADTAVAAENIRGGVQYLDWLLTEFDGDPILALAGYNAGENAVKRHGGVPDYPETRGYVPKVLAAWSVARGLCRTPPMLVSDGCVFIGGGA
jgi:soluble lytic murein transglycosylase-like protein